MREYDQIAEWFTATRDSAVGVPDLAAFAATLPPHARVLDLGCGDGVPVSRLFHERGCDLAAVDSSQEMVRRFRANLPGVAVQCARILDARFPAESFDAAVAWGVLFHLTEANQASAIGNVAEWLRPGGRFLFTSGAAEGVTEGKMDGVVFRYVSLGVERYGRVLAESGLCLDDEHTDAWGNHVFDAVKTA